MPDPFMGNTRTPRGAGLSSTAGGAQSAGRRMPGQQQEDGASPLQPLISPQNNTPFASMLVPAPTVALAAAFDVGYYGLQYVGGCASGTLNFVGYNLRMLSTLNSGAFPLAPSWGAVTQDGAVGNVAGLAAGVVIIHTSALGQMRPVLNGWVGGSALFPWLLPAGSTTYTGGTDRQVIGHPFPVGDLDSDCRAEELTPRDMPLGWDVNYSEGVWVLLAVQRTQLAALNAGTFAYMITNGRLIFADSRRQNPVGG